MPSSWLPLGPSGRRCVVTAVVATLVLGSGCAGRTESGAERPNRASTSAAPTRTTPLFATTTAPPTTRLPDASTTSVAPAGPSSNPTEPSTTTAATATTAAPASSAAGVTSAPSTTIPVGPVACPPTGAEIWEVRPPSDIAPPPLPAAWRTAVIGRSVQGRDVTALVRPVDTPRRRVVVIGGLHGNEPVSPPTVRGLVTVDHPDDVEVWLVPEANPDGVAAGTRCNADGVDLNRNFDWTWRADDGGPAPQSEPEVQSLVRLVEGLQPDVVVWVHQPYGYVSSIGPTSSALETAWSAAAGVPVQPDVTQHGGGESWTAFVAGRRSMLIEIDSWAATPEIVAAHRAGYEAMLAALG